MTSTANAMTAIKSVMC